MADDCECTLTQETLWKFAKKAVRGDFRGNAADEVCEIVLTRSAGAVACKEEREGSAQSGGIANVLAGEIELRRDPSLLLQRAGPVLAEERALMHKLARVAIRKTHTVTCRK